MHRLSNRLTEEWTPAVAGSGLLGAGYGSGWSGASLGVATAIASSFGVNLDTAFGHMAHDIGVSTALGGLTALGALQ